MQPRLQVPLADHTTMRLGGPAGALVAVVDRDALVAAVDWAAARSLPLFVLGEGSNVIARDEGFDGLVLVNRLPGFEVGDDDGTTVLVRVGAGAHWDGVVARAVDLGLSGIELLTAIPGTTGATPVQNVGAYGAEIADTLVELEAYDTVERRLVTLSRDECGFGYRQSRFKPLAGRRHVITAVTLRLTRTPPAPPFYPTLQRWLDANGVTEHTPAALRAGVAAVRATRLPDPARLPNTGSFFKNPLVDGEVAAAVLAAHPDAPSWPQPDGRVKLAAGWLIEAAGMKGHRSHGMWSYERNALVFVNESARGHKDLLAFQEEVAAAVRDRFGVSLEQEPELL